jgi:predicted membrane-bound spermidine synthase
VTAGFIAGLEFPLVSHILISHDCTIGTAAGQVDAVDHLGACAGSFFTGALLMPLAGIYQTCFIMGFLNISSVLFLMLQLKMDKN